MKRQVQNMRVVLSLAKLQPVPNKNKTIVVIEILFLKRNVKKTKQIDANMQPSERKTKDKQLNKLQ